MEILARAAGAAALTSDGRGGIFPTSTDAVQGAPLPSLDHSWLALAPFETKSLPTDRAARDEALRRRMKLLEVIVRLSMTRRYDWQTRFTNATSGGFHWVDALERLEDPGITQNMTRLVFPQTTHTLRWGHPKWLLALVDEPVSDTYPGMLETFLSAVATDNSHEWKEHRAFRDLLNDDQQLSATAATRHRVVELGIAIYGGQVTTLILHRIFDVLEQFEAAQQRRHDESVATGAAVSIEFRVTSIRFSVVCELASNALARLGERVRGLRFLTHVRLNVRWRVEARSFQQCLTELTGSRDAGSEEHGGATRPFSLSVESEVSSFACLGATVRYPGALRELDTKYVAQDMATFAAWLAFGLFHADSESQVSTIRLRMPGTPATVEHRPPYALCCPEWIDTFKRVLTNVISPEDLAPITLSAISKKGKRKRTSFDGSETDLPLDELDLPRDRRVMVTVRAKTKVFAQPSTRSELLAVLGTTAKDDLRDMTRFQVVRRLRAWLALAIPGAGAGWIRASGVVAEDTIPTKLFVNDINLRGNGRVKSFTWLGGAYPADDDLRGPHADSLMELLAYIGEPLEELHLPWMALRNHHVTRILEACPNLRELNVANNEITDIAPLVAAYASGRCKITSLNVSQYGEVNERILHQVATIVALDASPLKRLVVRATRVDATTAVVALRDALLHSKASRLEYVRVHCDDLDEHDDYERLAGDIQLTSAQVHMLFRDLLGRPPRCTRPMPVRNKAAMLSVWKHRQMEASALSALDTGVLAHIMELARTSHERTVEIWDR